MEIILILALLALAVWWVFFRDPLASKQEEPAPYKVETPPEHVNPQITDAVTQQPAWHTAPAEGTKLAENSLDVNHDGKVDLADVVEVVKKTTRRVKKAADVNGDGKVSKADAKAAVNKVKEKAAPKKAAAMKAKPKSKKA